MTVYLFSEGPVPSALNAFLRLKPASSSNTARANIKAFKTSSEEVNYLLYTYSSDDLIGETDATLTRHTQPKTMDLTQYADAEVTGSL